MRRLAVVLVLLLTVAATPAAAATDVWLFYGAGPPALSSGIDVMARRIRTLSGIGHVSVHRYYDTTTVYNQILQRPASDKAVVVGYSCGGNASLAVAQSLSYNNRQVAVLAVQPSVWCGWYLPTTSNVAYAQDTYGNCLQTLGLGCLQFYGDAQRTVLIHRPDLHLQADSDPNSIRDVVRATYCIANPSRCRPLIRHLRGTTTLTRYNGEDVLRLQE